MAISLVDTAVPMNDTGYPVARAKHIWFDDNATLQDKLDNKELGGDNSQTLTEAEYLALPEEQKLNNSYYLYDIGVHYKNGVAYSRKKPIQLTMAEYKALGEVDPDQEYIVSADEQGILLGAEDIGYNNAESGIQATTVQGAIDAVLRSKSATRMDESVNPENYEVGAWFAEGHDSISLSTSDGHPCSEWHIGYVVTGYKASDSNGYKIILAIAMSGNCYIKVQQWDKWTKWINIGTTSVADVGNTVITPEDADISYNYQMFYYVSNGICYVTLWGIISKSTGQDKVICSSLPKANISISQNILDKDDGSVIGIAFLNEKSTKLTVCVYKADARGYATFSYPVAE